MLERPARPPLVKSSGPGRPSRRGRSAVGTGTTPSRGPVGDSLADAPCQDHPAKWDLDAAGRADGFIDDWRAAIVACGTCPGRRGCRALLAEHYPRHDPEGAAGNPKGVIWAGVAYGDTGKPLADAQLIARHNTLRARAARGAA